MAGSLGAVPDDAVMGRDREWQLAHKTTWWGKPLDPKEFWKGRTIWLDESARLAAARKGRGYPPMPYDDPSIPHYQDDENAKQYFDGGPEGLGLGFYTRSRERAFWGQFSKTQPKPPAELEREQFGLAETIIKLRHDLKFAPAKRTAQDAEELEKIFRKRVKEIGYPAEPFSDQALHAAYVSKMKVRYENCLPVSKNVLPACHPTNEQIRWRSSVFSVD